MYMYMYMYMYMNIYIYTVLQQSICEHNMSAKHMPAQHVHLRYLVLNKKKAREVGIYILYV